MRAENNWWCSSHWRNPLSGRKGATWLWALLLGFQSSSDHSLECIPRGPLTLQRMYNHLFQSSAREDVWTHCSQTCLFTTAWAAWCVSSCLSLSQSRNGGQGPGIKICSQDGNPHCRGRMGGFPHTSTASPPSLRFSLLRAQRDWIVETSQGKWDWVHKWTWTLRS